MGPAKRLFDGSRAPQSWTPTLRAHGKVPASQGRMRRRRWFPGLGFPPVAKKAKGWRRLSRWTWFGAPLSADVVRPRALKWADPKALVPRPRLVEPRGRGQTEQNCANRKGNMSALFARTRFGLNSTDRRQPFIPAASATLSVFEPIPSVPIFEAEAAIRRRSSARRDLTIVGT
jgi:hypothetical protein